MGNLSQHFDTVLDRIACPCGCGYDNIDHNIINIMEKVREAIKHPLIVSSGCRCSQYNKKVSHVNLSAHTKGKAVDIVIKNSRDRMLAIQVLLENNIKRIGVGKNFIHFDNDNSLPQNVMWDYYK